MAGNKGGSFERYLEMLPVPPNKIVGSALSWFLKRQNPENIELDLYPNGYRITVMTDSENVKDMKEFWEEYVEPELGDSND